jgi:hypothetical protein
LIIIIAFCALGLVILKLTARRVSPARSPQPIAPVEDEAHRRERQNAAEEIGTELIQRRVALDGRRGPLAGDTLLLDEFERLEQRLHAGEISEDEFEAEKIRLLSE